MITTGEGQKSSPLCNYYLLILDSGTHKITILLLALIVFKRLVFITAHQPDLWLLIVGLPIGHAVRGLCGYSFMRICG